MVHGKIGPIAIPFILDNNDACSHCGLSCPLEANKMVTYNKSFPILSIYPNVSIYYNPNIVLYI